MDQPSLIENPFLKKAQSQTNTTPMSDEVSELFIMITLADQKGKQVTEDLQDLAQDPLCDVLLRRIKVFELPVKFTPNGLLALSLLAGGHMGKTVIGLIDAVTKYEGKPVTFSDVVELYPFGMYNDETAKDYIDNYLKPRRVKWSDVYVST